MAVYIECDGTSERELTVALGIDAELKTRTWVSGNYEYYEEYKDAQFTVSPTPQEDLTIDYSVESSSDTSGNCQEGTYTRQYKTIELLAGQSSYSKELIYRRTECYTKTGAPEGSPCTTLDCFWYQNYQVEEQTDAPICDPAPDCQVTIDSVTDVSIRGAADGEIQASATPTDASTYTWYLNGVEWASLADQSAVTFTNLEPGFYNVRADVDTCVNSVKDVQVEEGAFRTGDMQIREPSNLTAAENPILYDIKTARSSDGRYAICEFEIKDDATIQDGDYFKFVLTSPFEYTQTFYAKGFPSQSNYFLATQLTDDDGVNYTENTTEEIAQSFADALQQDKVIPKVYAISYNGDRKVTLKAKEITNRLTLSSQNVFTNTSNLIVNKIQSGENKYDGQQLDSYSIYVEVFRNDDSFQYPNAGQNDDYIRVAELELPFSQDNDHRFNLSPILKNDVFTTRPRPSKTGHTVQPDMLKPYKIRYGEKYNVIKNTNTKKKRYKGSSDIKWFINSALGHYQVNDMNEHGFLGNYFHNLKANFKGDITTSADTLTIDINDYKYDDSREDTDYQFKFISNSMGDSGWQTGSTYTFTGYPEPFSDSGSVSISAVTSGITITYDKDWYVLDSLDGEGTIEGYSNRVEKVANINFLTNSPNPKLIQRNSQEYLYFILQGNYNEKLIVKGDLYFYDGSEELDQEFFTIQESSGNTAGGVLALNLSYDKLGLSDYETTTGAERRIKRAEIAVYQQDSGGNELPYTNARSYRFEFKDKPRKYGVIFQNNLGGYDSVSFVGIVEESINRESGRYTVPVDYTIDGSANEGFKSSTTYNTRVTNKVTVNTGWIDQDHFNWLKELMQSNDIYSITTENLNYLNLDSFKYKKSSLDDLYEVECTFIETIYLNSIDVN